MPAVEGAEIALGYLQAPRIASMVSKSWHEPVCSRDLNGSANCPRIDEARNPA